MPKSSRSATLSALHSWLETALFSRFFFSLLVRFFCAVSPGTLHLCEVEKFDCSTGLLDHHRVVQRNSGAFKTRELGRFFLTLAGFLQPDATARYNPVPHDYLSGIKTGGIFTLFPLPPRRCLMISYDTLASTLIDTSGDSLLLADLPSTSARRK